MQTGPVGVNGRSAGAESLIENQKTGLLSLYGTLWGATKDPG
jgi:hypothetical protein